MVKLGKDKPSVGAGVGGQGVKVLDENPTTAGEMAGENTWHDDQVRRRNEDVERARNELGRMEKGASGENSGIGEGGEALSDAEAGGAEDGRGESGKSFYDGAGKALAKVSPMGRAAMTLSALGGGGKKKGPIITLLLILLIGGGIIIGAQSLQPFAIAGRMKDELNSLEVSMNQRSDPLMRYMLKKERKKMAQLALIFDGDKFQPTEKQKNQLKKQGIEIVDGDGDEKLLEFTDSDGKKKSYTFGEVKDNVHLRNKYIAGASSYRGGTSGWLTKLASVSLKRLGISRNKFSDFNASEEDSARKKKFVELARKDSDDINDKGGNIARGTKEDSEGNKQSCAIGSSGCTTEINSAGDEKITNRKDKVSTKSALVSKASKAASAFGAGNLICAAYSAFEVIQTVVAAQQMMENLGVASSFLEAVDKVKAGDGKNSPLNDYMDTLNEPYEEKDDDGNVIDIGSAMEAGGMAALFGVAATNVAQQRSVMNMNSESKLSEVTLLGISGLTKTGEVLTNCAYAKIIGATVDATVTMVSAVATFGIGFLVKEAIGTLISIGAGWALEGVVGAIAGAAVEMIAASYLDEVFGKGMGEALVSGMHKYMGQMHQGSGGTPASGAYITKFKNGASKMMAEKAEYERETLSPFDISSENTFLGSITYNLVAMGIAGGGRNKLASSISGVSRVVGRSVQMLTPAASAVDRTSLMLQKGECPTTETVGAYADIYCNPYEITDLDTIDIDPPDLFLKIRGDNSKNECVKWDEDNHCTKRLNWPTNFKYTSTLTYEDGIDYWYDVQVDSSGNPVINPDSKLGAFAIACNTRTAPLGLASSEVASFMDGLNMKDGTRNGGSSGVLGSIPLVGNGADILEAASTLENAGWISGQYCVASEDNELWNDGSGVGLKWYQRYLEDQNWMEAAGLIGQSSTVALLDDYYEEHPLDNSYEGTLARFSGLDRETVENALALVEYQQWVAAYDPSELGPVKVPEVEEVSLVEQVLDGVGKVAEVVGIVYERVMYGEPRMNARIG